MHRARTFPFALLLGVLAWPSTLLAEDAEVVPPPAPPPGAVEPQAKEATATPEPEPTIEPEAAPEPTAAPEAEPEPEAPPPWSGEQPPPGLMVSFTGDLEQSEDALYALGKAAFNEGDFAVAAVYLWEILRRDPGHRTARNYLVESLRVAGYEDLVPEVVGGQLPAAPTAPRGEAAPAAQLDVRVELSGPREEREPWRHNPRERTKAYVGLGLGGPTLAMGAMFSLEPGWFFSLKAGIGGGGALLGAFFGEVELMPLPFVISPTLGLGVSALAGPDAYKLDPWIAALAPQADLRVVPYASLGVRLDAGKHFLAALSVLVTASGKPRHPLAGFPSLRIGYRF